MVDESPTLARVRRATQARNCAERAAKTARLEQLDAIEAADAAGDKQKDIVEITGLTRERIRQICIDARKAAGPSVADLRVAREAVTGGSLLENLRASLSAAVAGES
jgi:hypothetical protein